MATGTLGVASTLVAYTNSAQADSVAARDSSGDCSFRNLTASGYVTSAGLNLGIATKIAHYTALATDHTILCNAASGAITVTLPAAASSSGVVLVIKKLDATNNVTIDGNASETIDGATTKVLSSQYATAIIQCDGTAWHVLAQ